MLLSTVYTRIDNIHKIILIWFYKCAYACQIAAEHQLYVSEITTLRFNDTQNELRQKITTNNITLLPFLNLMFMCMLD